MIKLSFGHAASQSRISPGWSNENYRTQPISSISVIGALLVVPFTVTISQVYIQFQCIASGVKCNPKRIMRWPTVGTHRGWCIKCQYWTHGCTIPIQNIDIAYNWSAFTIICSRGISHGWENESMALKNKMMRIMPLCFITKILNCLFNSRDVDIYKCFYAGLHYTIYRCTSPFCRSASVDGLRPVQVIQ